jgi:UDP-N-acetyl-D-glucosamine dehydrogenase
MRSPASVTSIHVFSSPQMNRYAVHTLRDLAEVVKGVAALILAVPHAPYLALDPNQIVQWAGGPIAVVDCFGILPDEKIRRYFELGCEVKALGRGHIQRIKKEVKEGA